MFAVCNVVYPVVNNMPIFNPITLENILDNKNAEEKNSFFFSRCNPLFDSLMDLSTYIPERKSIIFTCINKNLLEDYLLGKRTFTYTSNYFPHLRLIRLIRIEHTYRNASE